MARVKSSTSLHKRHKKILNLAKGYFGSKHKLYRPANEQVMKSLSYSYAHRKKRQGDFRRLWITRINAAARINGLSYSKLINGLKLSGVEINRKMLAEMAVNDDAGFVKLTDLAKKSLK